MDRLFSVGMVVTNIAAALTAALYACVALARAVRVGDGRGGAARDHGAQRARAQQHRRR